MSPAVNEVQLYGASNKAMQSKYLAKLDETLQQRSSGTNITLQELIILYIRVGTINITRESRPCSSSNWSPSNRVTLL